MNMQAAIGGRAELRRQAEICRNLGSPFVASVLEAGSRQLPHAPYTEALIAAWPGDRASAAMAMRFNGALHALARRATPPELAALYRGDHEDFDGAIATALATGDRFIATWMRHPTQTNEVGRAAAILAALMVVSRQVRMPFELLELGTSCGLNLNLARYAYNLGGVQAGATDSPVRIVPEWRGPQPLYAPVDVVSAHGVDLHPLDATDPDACERLLAFMWADQHDRSVRLQQALELARRHPPRIDQADALDWVKERLSTPQAAGLCRVVFHSMFKQYLGKQDQLTLTDEIVRAGEAATQDSPFACISLEWTPDRSEVQLALTCWPDGETRFLATCHPYGSWVHWR